MQKKKYHVLLSPEVHRRIKASASLFGLTIGQYLTKLQSLQDNAQYMTDEDFQGQLNTLMEVTMTGTNRPDGESYE